MARDRIHFCGLSNHSAGLCPLPIYLSIYFAEIALSSQVSPDFYLPALSLSHPWAFQEVGSALGYPAPAHILSHFSYQP